MKTVLAIDPGREKCGLAVVTGSGVLQKEIIPRAEIADTIPVLASRHAVSAIIIGDGTGGRSIREEIARIVAVPIEMIDETLSTRRARARFFLENPPRGIRRLIPQGLQVPDRPYDDYVAIILAEDYLSHI